MFGKSVLLHTRDKAGARRLSTCLRAAGNDVVRTEVPLAAVDLISARSVDIVFLDFDTSPSCTLILEAAQGRVPVVVTSARRDPSALLDLVCKHEVDHLLMRASGLRDSGDTETLLDIDPREVVVTAEKILRRQLFGLDKYLPGFGVDLSGFEVRNIDDRSRVVGEVQAFVGALGAGRGVDAAAALVADELISNAIYAAPRDGEGNPQYAVSSRRRDVTIDPWQAVRVRFGSDGERFVLSVTDYFGTLGPDAIRRTLHRCLTSRAPIRGAEGGAGLGLYMVLTTCNQLVLNVQPGVCTEAVAIIDISDRMRGIRRSARSLHLFTQRTQGAAVARRIDAVPSDKIVVSDTMRWELNSALGNVTRAPIATRRVLPSIPDSERPLRVGEGSGQHPLARGALLDPTVNQLGIDTTRGLLRGAPRVDVALEAAMRFLSSYYAGVVAYAALGEQLVPWFAMGGVSDWERVQSLRIGMRDPCSLSRLARDRLVADFRPSTSPLDHKLARYTAGQSSARALVFPICRGGVTRFALYAFIPRFDRWMLPSATETLRDELESVLERIESAPDEAMYESYEMWV